MCSEVEVRRTDCQVIGSRSCPEAVLDEVAGDHLLSTLVQTFSAGVIISSFDTVLHARMIPALPGHIACHR